MISLYIFPLHLPTTSFFQYHCCSIHILRVFRTVTDLEFNNDLLDVRIDSYQNRFITWDFSGAALRSLCSLYIEMNLKFKKELLIA